MMNDVKTTNTASGVSHQRSRREVSPNPRASGRLVSPVAIPASKMRGGEVAAEHTTRGSALQAFGRIGGNGKTNQSTSWLRGGLGGRGRFLGNNWPRQHWAGQHRPQRQENQPAEIHDGNLVLQMSKDGAITRSQSAVKA